MCEVGEGGVGFLERYFYCAGGAVAVFGDYQLGDGVLWAVSVGWLVAVDEYYDVGVLFYRSGFAEVA